MQNTRIVFRKECKDARRVFGCSQLSPTYVLKLLILRLGIFLSLRVKQIPRIHSKILGVILFLFIYLFFEVERYAAVGIQGTLYTIIIKRGGINEDNKS